MSPWSLPRNLSVRSKLIMGVATVHLVLMTVFVLDLVHRQRDFLLQEASASALKQARLTADAASSWVLADDVAGMAEVLESSHQGSSLRYALIADPQGQVLAHTDRRRVGQFLSDPVSLAALQATSAPQIWQTDRHTIHSSAPITVDNRIIGWVLLGLDTTPTYAHLNYVSLNGLIYTLVAILAGTAFAWLLARSMLRQLHLLLQGADRLGDNRLDQPVPVINQDEIGRVAQALNNAMGSLRDSQAKVQEEMAERRRAEQDIRYLSRRLMDSSEEERKRIGHDLHDELGQMITGFQFGLQSLSETLPQDPAQAGQICGSLVNQAEEMGDTISRIACHLWPATLEHLGLSVALQSHVREFNRRLPELHVNFCTQECPARLPSRLELVCFRIIQEALNNIARHAQAENVEISLQVRDAHLRLMIRDDGQGMAAAVFSGRDRRPRHGIGILGMRERAATTGGRLHIVSAPGEGCTIWADLPIIWEEESLGCEAAS